MTAATLSLLAIFLVAGTISLVAGITGRGWLFTTPGSLFSAMPRRVGRLLAVAIGVAVYVMTIMIFDDAFLSLSAA